MLYGVFIMDDSDECLSEWLILFTGVGDEDLPPCLSRESLQLKKMELYAGSAKRKDGWVGLPIAGRLFRSFRYWPGEPNFQRNLCQGSAFVLRRTKRDGSIRRSNTWVFPLPAWE